MARVRPHFKIHTSVQSHRKMVKVYADNDLLAIWIRLGVRAIERYASQTRDRFLLAGSDLTSITGKKTVGEAIEILKELESVSPIVVEEVKSKVKGVKSRVEEVEVQSRIYEVTFPNLAKKQGFNPKELSKNCQRIAAPDTETDTEAETEAEADSKNKTTPRKRGGNGAGKVKAPEELSFRHHVRVRLWFAYCFPGETEGAAELMIEEALTYYQSLGTRYAVWSKAIINNIRSRRTTQQRREDRSYKCRSLKEAKSLHRQTNCAKYSLAAVGELIRKLDLPPDKLDLAGDEWQDIQNALGGD